MLYGWIEIGLSNNAIFNHESNQDIILRTIYDNKIILGNTSNTGASAGIYISGNNVGIKKVPQSNMALDVAGDARLQSIYAQTFTLLSNVNFTITNTCNSVDFTYSNANKMKITSADGVQVNDTFIVNNDIYANTYNLTSDVRFKTNINLTNHEQDISTLKQIQVKDYLFRNNPEKTIKGFIAQELESVFPQAVNTNISLDGIKTIDTTQILALNTSTLQSILTRLEQLEKYVYENK